MTVTDTPHDPTTTRELAAEPRRSQEAPMADTMRAAVRETYGPADVVHVAEVPVPEPAPGEVRVRVTASSLDRGTWHLVGGTPYLVRVAGFGVRRPKQPVIGIDLAGTVEAVGEGIERLAVGDAVFGTADGAFAERVVTRVDRLAHAPASLTAEQAAALPVSGLTALQALRDRVRLEPGDHVAILGASGGVGTFAVQLAKAMGAEVTAVCSAGKADLVRELGADHVVDYATTALEATGTRYDAIVDVGGLRPVRHLRRALTARGRLVIAGGEGKGRITGGVGRQLRAFLLSPFVSQQLSGFLASEKADDLEALARYVEAGELRPAIDSVRTLDEVPQALRDLEAGRVRGKVVITI